MLPASVDDAIRGMAEDRTSGASKLGRLALETMGLAIMESTGRPDPGELADVARLVSQAQPAMAIVHNVAHLVAQLVTDGQDPKAVLQEIGAELESARARIARTFLKIAPPRDATIVTLSHSDNVLESLRTAHARAPLARVYVLESRPRFEGRALAKALADAGVPATVVADALGPSLLSEATCALVGADSVLRDGTIVNKIGTYGLALAAADHHKAFYVVCETLKFDARYDAGSWPGVPARDPKELWDGAMDRLDAVNRYFDVTPGRLITTIATERGTYAPDVVRTMLSPGREPGPATPRNRVP